MRDDDRLLPVKLMESIIGVADHNGWAVTVLVSDRNAVLDRRVIRLVDDGLPKMPYHHEAQSLPLAEAKRLIGKVKKSADKHSQQSLESIIADHRGSVAGIALRECPPLPASIQERITTYNIQTIADPVMYRRALAGAAQSLGLKVFWYKKNRVMDEARKVCSDGDIESFLKSTGKTLGPPWQKDHKTATAAAMAAFRNM